MRHGSTWRQQVAIGLIMLVVGLVCGRLGVTGEYAALLKPSMRPWLLASAAVIVLAAGWTLWRARRDLPTDPHAHPGVATIGALLLVPMLVLCTLPTPSAGLYLAKRGNPDAGAVPADLPPLPTDAVVGIRLDHYVIRTTLRDPADMRGRTFRVAAVGADPQPDNLWVEVTGEWMPADGTQSQLRVTQVRPVAVPERPLLT